ncbi:MAG: methyltransferase [Pseudomonadota bacterium]
MDAPIEPIEREGVFADKSLYSHDVFLSSAPYGPITLVQPKKGFRAGSDAIFLAMAQAFPEDSHILDVGCGAGLAALTALSANKNIKITGLEKQEFYADTARHNAEINRFSDSFSVVQGDIKNALTLFPPDFFTHILTNPPYYAEGAGRKSPLQEKSISHQAEDISLKIWIRSALSVLKNHGTIMTILRTERLSDMLEALMGRAGGIVIFPLFSREDQNTAKRVIVKATKASKTPPSLRKGITIHDGDSNAYSAHAKQVINGGAFLGI